MEKALVLLNMGGARNKEEFIEFLTNMFNDKNILTIKNGFLRSFVASMIVLTRKNSAWKNYEEIGGSSPLHDITQKLVDKLQTVLPDVYITQAMRYTQPNSQACIEELKKKNIKNIVLLPLYPQYSTTTSKSSIEEMVQESKDDFSIDIIEPFFKHESFNELIINEIISNVHSSKYNEYDLVFSAHGLPQKIVDSGDPYEQQMQEHVELLKNKMVDHGIEFNSVSLAYQSKVGPMKWLTPSLDDTLTHFKNKKVIVYPLSFIIDNSETVFELDIEYREIADEIGLKEFIVCSCPNDSDAFMNVVIDLLANMGQRVSVA